MVDAGGLYPAAGRWDRNSVQLPIGLLLLDYRELGISNGAISLFSTMRTIATGATMFIMPVLLSRVNLRVLLSRNVDHRLRLLCDGRAF